MARKEDDELVTLKVASERTGVPSSTLRRAARLKQLEAEWQDSPFGSGGYMTTVNAVKKWKASPEFHRMGRRKLDG